MTFPARIWLNSTNVGPLTGPLELDSSSTSTVKKYYITVNSTSQHGIEFHHATNGDTELKVNEISNAGASTTPDIFIVTRNNQTLSSTSSGVVLDGDQIDCYDPGGNAVFGFIIDMNGSSYTDGNNIVHGPNKLIFGSNTNPPGSGSGIQTLSGGNNAEIINVAFRRTGENTVAMDFEYQNIQNVTIRKQSLDGTLYSATITPSGYESNPPDSNGEIEYTLTDGDTWWMEHSDFLDLPRYEFKLIHWTFNRQTKILTARGWWPDNGSNGFGGNSDVALFTVTPDGSGGWSPNTKVAQESKSTTLEKLLAVQTHNEKGVRYGVFNVDTTQYGNTTYRIARRTNQRNFW